MTAAESCAFCSGQSPRLGGTGADTEHGAGRLTPAWKEEGEEEGIKPGNATDDTCNIVSVALVLALAQEQACSSWLFPSSLTSAAWLKITFKRRFVSQSRL